MDPAGARPSGKLVSSVLLQSAEPGHSLGPEGTSEKQRREEPKAFAREAPAVALCAGRLRPGSCRGRVFEAGGPGCVFSIMKVNQKENVQFQGLSQSALVRECCSASCFIL